LRGKIQINWEKIKGGLVGAVGGAIVLAVIGIDGPWEASSAGYLL